VKEVEEDEEEVEGVEDVEEDEDEFVDNVDENMKDIVDLNVDEEEDGVMIVCCSNRQDALMLNDYSLEEGWRFLVEVVRVVGVRERGVRYFPQHLQSFVVFVDEL
jgi:hypothetical protein